METVVKYVMFENVTKSEGSRVNVQNAESKVRDTGPKSRNINSSQMSQNWNILRFQTLRMFSFLVKIQRGDLKLSKVMSYIVQPIPFVFQFY